MSEYCYFDQAKHVAKNLIEEVKRVNGFEKVEKQNSKDVLNALEIVAKQNQKKIFQTKLVDFYL